MFQNFSAPKFSNIINTHIDALRARFTKLGINALWVPRTDEYQGEYVPACAERLAWLTGFTGSAGLAIITENKAALFTDGRYTLQANQQLDTNQITPYNTADMPATKWLEDKATPALKLGVDPWLITLKEYEALAKLGTIVLLPNNPIDALWQDRPKKPFTQLSLQPDELTGCTRGTKIANLQSTLKEAGVKATVLTQPESIAWAFNIRGQDVPHTPLSLAYALVPANGKPTLFINKNKLTSKVQSLLETNLTIAAEEDFAPALKAAKGTVQIDPTTCPYAIITLLKSATTIHAQDPCIAPRAIKTPAEQKGARAAHLRDGVAVTRFLSWLDRQQTNTLNEIRAAKKLESLRTEEGKRDGCPLLDVSFDSISGIGANGAIIHYRVTEETNTQFYDATLYLIDSGGQYRDGTTDITRTIAIGTPSQEMKKTATLVLKGMIAVTRARFPNGTSGTALDTLARSALWHHGLDYDHGTGHGVGSYLSVHEGPQRISKAQSVPLQAGMILSNEPGHYKQGEYGIRIENLILVQNAEGIEGGERPMMGFETLTFAPIDKRLIESALLNKEEIEWLNNYHATVKNKLMPHLQSEEERTWLEEATGALTQ